MKLLWMVAGAALVSASTGYAQDDEEKEEEEVICKTERVTGSRTRVNRICMTQAQWDAQAEAARRGVGDLNREATNNNTGVGAGN